MSEVTNISVGAAPAVKVDYSKDLNFVSACKSCKTMKELVERTGYKESTISQRRSTLRKVGWVIPEFTRGGGSGRPHVSHAPTEADFSALAALEGKTVEEVKAESAAVIAAVIAAGEKIKAGKVGKVNLKIDASIEAATANAEITPPIETTTNGKAQ